LSETNEHDVERVEDKAPERPKETY
jgi:hypothetical protein